MGDCVAATTVGTSDMSNLAGPRVGITVAEGLVGKADAGGAEVGVNPGMISGETLADAIDALEETMEGTKVGEAVGPMALGEMVGTEVSVIKGRGGGNAA